MLCLSFGTQISDLCLVCYSFMVPKIRNSLTEVQRLSFPPCFYKGSWLQSTCPDRAVNKQQIQCTQATALKDYYSNKESCTVAGGPRQKQGGKDTRCTSVRTENDRLPIGWLTLSQVFFKLSPALSPHTDETGAHPHMNSIM